MTEKDKTELVLMLTGLIIASVVGLLLGGLICEGVYQILCWYSTA